MVMLARASTRSYDGRNKAGAKPYHVQEPEPEFSSSNNRRTTIAMTARSS